MPGNEEGGTKSYVSGKVGWPGRRRGLTRMLYEKREKKMGEAVDREGGDTREVRRQHTGTWPLASSGRLRKTKQKRAEKEGIAAKLLLHGQPDSWGPGKKGGSR